MGEEEVEGRRDKGCAFAATVVLLSFVLFGW